MKVAELLARARSARGDGIAYQLGKGGFDPAAPTPATDGACDCSGFVCWALGLSRVTDHPLYVALNGGGGSKGWINTDSIVHDASRRTGFFEPLEAPRRGCLVVFPRGGGARLGHVGIVTTVKRGGAARVVHCSKTNYARYRDSIRETPPDVFGRPGTIWAWYAGLEG